MPIFSSVELVLCVLLVSASVSDIGTRRIPNSLLLAALLAACVIHLLTGSLLSVLTAYLGGFAIGMMMFLPLYIKGSMAAGDVKLMATVGALTGPSLAFQISLVTYCAGGLLALGMVLVTGRSRQAFANVGAVIRPVLMRWVGIPAVDEPLQKSVGGMPYAVAIALGTLAVLWFRHS